MAGGASGWPLDRGLYETLVTEALAALLDVDADHDPDILPLHHAEAADRLALHLGRVIERSLAGVEDQDRVEVGIRLTRALIERIDQIIKGADNAGDRPVDPGQVLSAILGRLPDGSPAALARPLIPLLDTTLFTNAPGEPRVGRQVQTEIGSADRIDVVMAFIRRSGIRPMLEEHRHCKGQSTAGACESSPPPTPAPPREALDLLPNSAPRYGSPTTRPPPACTRRPGSSIATPAPRRRSSARRTDPLSPDQRSGVERARLGGAKPRRDPQGDGDVRGLLGGRRLPRFDADEYGERTRRDGTRVRRC